MGCSKEIRRGEKSGETTCTIEEIRKEEIPSVVQVNLKKGGAEKIERKEQQQQTENITENITEMRDLRMEIEEKIVSMNHWLSPRPWSAAKLIYKFERKLGAAVARMARLGAIEEEEKQTPSQADKTELSLDSEEKIGAEKYVVGPSLAENVNTMTDVIDNGEKDDENIGAEKYVMGLSLADSMSKMMGLTEKSETRLSLAASMTKMMGLTEKDEMRLSLAEFENETAGDQVGFNNQNDTFNPDSLRDKIVTTCKEESLRVAQLNQQTCENYSEIKVVRHELNKSEKKCNPLHLGETPPRVALLSQELQTFGTLIVSLEMALSENEWYSENVINYASGKSLEDTLEIFTISEELLEEIVCKVMAPINEIGICVNVKRKRKLNEDLGAQIIESPAKRRAQVQSTCDEAPEVQTICDEAPEVQKKTEMVQIGQDSPKDSPQDPPPRPTHPQSE